MALASASGIMLLMSSMILAALFASGVFSITLGVWHLGVPRWFAFRRALASPDTDLGVAMVGPLRYERRVADVMGLSWVMSNAASYVLITIGAVDLTWVFDPGTPSSGLAAMWIAGWWMIRGGGQLLVGRRVIDGVLMAAFTGLAVIHVAVALSGG